jgi:hypothetical protein
MRKGERVVDAVPGVASQICRQAPRALLLRLRNEVLRVGMESRTVLFWGTT